MTRVDDQSTFTRPAAAAPCVPKYFSKTRSAAGAAADEPWPPFSITAQTTSSASSDGPVPAPPRLVLEMADRIAGEVDDLLGGPRLAGDRDRVACRRRPTTCRSSSASQPRARRGRPASAAGSTPASRGGSGGNCCSVTGCCPVRARLLDAGDDVRRHELAAVRDHRVEAGHLQRRHRDVLLPDRELDRVTRVPGLVPVALERLLAPGRRRHDRLPRRSLVADVEARRRAEAELAGPLLHAAARRRAALVEAVADRVEVRVARRRERLRQVHRPVHVRIPVLELLLVAAVLGRRRALDRRVRREEVLLHRRERGDRLPGRARRVGDLRDAVEPGVVRRLRGGVVDERRELLRVDAPDVDRRLVGRVRRHRAHGAVARVERDDRAARDVVLLVGPGERDALPDRALGRALNVDVDREPDRRARLGVPPDLERALRAARASRPGSGRRPDVPCRYSSNVASTPDLPILSPPR